jgi:kynureninase
MDLVQTRSPRDLAAVRSWDAGDPLRSFRDRFDLPPNVVYLDGNSLGALPRATGQRIARVVADEWGGGLIRSWNDCDWIRAPRRVGDKIAGLIGAAPGEVIVADSTSANLFKLVHVALAARPGRREVLSEPGNFCTDLYVIEGALRGMPGRSLRLEPAERLIECISEDTALVVLTHVHYKSAAMHDMRAITARAHEKGALVLWDLSHSVGALQVDLNGCDADFAVGCGYKYLNGGPGAPAFLFVAQRHLASSVSPLSGARHRAVPVRHAAGARSAEPGVRRRLVARSRHGGVAGEVGRAVPAVHHAGGRNVWRSRSASAESDGRARARQPPRLRAPQRLRSHARADRSRCHRRFPRPRLPALRLGAAVHAL